MTMLPTRMLKPSCTNCQVGQGDICACRGESKSPRKPRLSHTALIRLVWAGDLIVVAGVAALVWWWAR